jgi:hypothetical protein
MIKVFIKELLTVRNGFDHAWTSKVMPNDINKQGKVYLISLKEVIDVLIKHNIL